MYLKLVKNVHWLPCLDISVLQVILRLGNYCKNPRWEKAEGGQPEEVRFGQAT